MVTYENDGGCLVRGEVLSVVTVRAWLGVLLFVGSGVSLLGQNFKIDLVVRTLDQGEKPVTGGDVEVTVGRAPERALPERDAHVFFRTLPQRIENLEITVEPPKGYANRSLRLRRLPREQWVLGRVVKAYVLPEDLGVSDQSLEDAKSLLEQGQFEKALSKAELLYRKIVGSSVGQGIKAQYNYARSLLECCKRFGYATCETAAKMCASLEARYSKYRKEFSRQGIEKADLNDCERIAGEVIRKEKAQVLLFEWKDVESVFSQGDYKAAAFRMDGILDSFDANAVVWITNGKPKWAVHADAGVAYFRYADSLGGEPAAAKQEALFKSARHFEQAVELGDTRPMTRSNWSLVESRLAAAKAQ